MELKCRFHKTSRGLIKISKAEEQDVEAPATLLDEEDESEDEDSFEEGEILMFYRKLRDGHPRNSVNKEATVDRVQRLEPCLVAHPELVPDEYEQYCSLPSSDWHEEDLRAFCMLYVPKENRCEEELDNKVREFNAKANLEDTWGKKLALVCLAWSFGIVEEAIRFYNSCPDIRESFVANSNSGISSSATSISAAAPNTSTANSTTSSQDTPPTATKLTSATHTNANSSSSSSDTTTSAAEDEKSTEDEKWVFQVLVGFTGSKDAKAPWKSFLEVYGFDRCILSVQGRNESIVIEDPPYVAWDQHTEICAEELLGDKNFRTKDFVAALNSFYQKLPQDLNAKQDQVHDLFHGSNWREAVDQLNNRLLPLLSYSKPFQQFLALDHIQIVNMEVEHAEHIAALLKVHPTIKSVYIETGTEMTIPVPELLVANEWEIGLDSVDSWPAIQLTAELLKGNQSLTSLSLYGEYDGAFDLDDPFYSNLLALFKDHTTLTRFKFHPESAEDVVRVLEILPNIKHLHADGGLESPFFGDWHAVAKHEALRELEVNSVDLRHFAKALESSTLSSIFVSSGVNVFGDDGNWWSEISDEWFDSVDKGMQTNTVLRSVHGKHFIYGVFPRLAHIFMKSHSLRSLHCGGTEWDKRQQHLNRDGSITVSPDSTFFFAEQNLSLTELSLCDIFDCYLGATHLATALKSNQTLKSLKIEVSKRCSEKKESEFPRCHVKAEDFVALAEALSENTTLTDLSLKGNPIGDNWATLQWTKNLQRLRVHHCKFGTTGNGRIVERLKMKPNGYRALTHLEIDTALDQNAWDGLFQVLRENTPLATLKLHGDISSSNTQMLAKALKVNTNCEIWMKHGKTQQKIPRSLITSSEWRFEASTFSCTIAAEFVDTLTVLDISSKASDCMDGAACLSQALERQDCKVATLHLNFNGHDARKVMAGLKHNKSIRCLHLEVYDSRPNYLQEELVEVLKVNNTLSVLKLRDPTDLFIKPGVLDRVLDLETFCSIPIKALRAQMTFENLTETEALVLVECLKRGHMLRKLQISHSKLQNQKSVESVAYTLSTCGLAELHLEECNFLAAVMEALCNNENRSIETLHLRQRRNEKETAISRQLWNRFLEWIKIKDSSLKKLVLNSLSIDNKICELLIDEFTKQNNLMELDLSDNSKITEIPIRLQLRLGHLPEKKLKLDCENIRSPPYEFANQTNWLQRYCADLAEGSSPVKRLRLMVVGFGGVGKTTFCRAMGATEPELESFKASLVPVKEWTPEMVEMWVRGLGDPWVDSVAKVLKEVGTEGAELEKLVTRKKDSIVFSSDYSQSFQLGKLQLDKFAKKIAALLDKGYHSTVGVNKSTSFTFTLDSEECQCELIDFAGQMEYYISHKLLFHMRAFYVVLQSTLGMEENFASKIQKPTNSWRYWLDFLGSSYPKSSDWSVHLAASKWDKLDERNSTFLENKIREEFDSICRSESYRVAATRLDLDYRKATSSVPDVKQLLQSEAETISKSWVVPAVYEKLSQYVRNEAKELESQQNKTIPLLSKSEFDELAERCDERFAKDPFLKTRATVYLKSKGDILAPSCLDCVLLDPIGWVTEFLAFFIRDDGKEIVKFRQGVCSFNDIKEAFQHKYKNESLDANLTKLMSVLCQLDLCMEIDDGKSYMFPCLLPIASSKDLCEEWAKSVESIRDGPPVFKGHRFVSTNKFLPSGTFSMLLIRLLKTGWIARKGFLKGKVVYNNWAKFIFHGYHVFVSVHSEMGFLDLVVIGKFCQTLDDFACICREFVSNQYPGVELKESWLCPTCLSHRHENTTQDWTHAIAVEAFSVHIERVTRGREVKQVAKLDNPPEDCTCSVFQLDINFRIFDIFDIFRRDLQKGKDKQKDELLGEDRLVQKGKDKKDEFKIGEDRLVQKKKNKKGEFIIAVGALEKMPYSKFEFVSTSSVPKGMQGYVRKAKFKGMQVAVKFPGAGDDYGSSADKTCEVQEEAEKFSQCWAQGYNPYLLNVIGRSVSPDGKFLLVLPWVGRSLYEELMDAKPHVEHTPQRQYDLALGCAKALESLHGKGFVHCDVAARNFLVEDKVEEGKIVPHIQICDLGFAHKENTKFNGRLEPAVIAPELQEGSDSYTGIVKNRCDIYSFALLLLEILLRKPNLSSYTINQRLTIDEPIPPNTPKGIRILIESCRKKQSDERPKSMKRVRKDLEAYIRMSD